MGSNVQILRQSGRGTIGFVVITAVSCVLTMNVIEPWIRMWGICVGLFMGCKWLTFRRCEIESTHERWVCYFLFWPGMNANAFVNLKGDGVNVSRAEYLRSFAAFICGLAFYFGIARLVDERLVLLQGWVGMLGLILMLHFGAFGLLSCIWRSYGVKAKPLMIQPMKSQSLGEFWGRRWNTAFRDLTHQFMFKPLHRWVGGGCSLWIGFLVSGLIHDLVISWPAGGGYGWPTVYFLLQALGLSIERSKIGRRMGVKGGMKGWLFTMLFVGAPLVLCFHERFVVEVIVPFMKVSGAL